MRRKIAFFATIVATVLFAVLRILGETRAPFMLGAFHVEDCLIAATLVFMVLIAALCFSKSANPCAYNESIRPASGWIITFCGALLIMSVVLDVFCWVAYHQVPPPNTHILNNVDFYSLILSLIFGACGGVFMILQGFNWMADSARNKTLLAWLSLTPVLWMWFRLARYEISYASTIDISKSFFDFATLVTASLFLLQLAKVTSGVGTQPKNGTVIFALFTCICSLSGLPLTFYRLSHGESINALLLSIVDASIGLLAIVYVFGLMFLKKPTNVEEDTDDSLAWTAPAKEHKPLDPPFSIDEKLPVLEAFAPQEPDEEKPVPDEIKEEKELTVDDILAELNKDGV